MYRHPSAEERLSDSINKLTDELTAARAEIERQRSLAKAWRTEALALHKKLDGTPVSTETGDSTRKDQSHD